MLINEQQDTPRSYHLQQDPENPHCARLCPVWRDLPVNRQDFAQHFDWDVEQLSPDVPFYLDIYDEEIDFNQKLKHLFYPLSNVTIRNHTFPAPQEARIFVEARYGPHWQTPDHQSREVASAGYPTLDEAEKWSKAAVLFEHVRGSRSASRRLLKRAHVEHKTQRVYVEEADLEDASLHSLTVASLELQAFRASSGGVVMNGTLLVHPPIDGEDDVTGFIMYWASERIIEWQSAEFKLTGTGVRLSKPADASSLHHVGPWSIPLPQDLIRPPNVTHIALACMTVEGESARYMYAPLDSGLASYASNESAESIFFTQHVSFALIRVLHPEDSAIVVPCIRRKYTLRPANAEAIFAAMTRKTAEDMKAALVSLSRWISPIARSLQECMDPQAHAIGDELASMLLHLAEPKEFTYIPGKQLDVDGKSWFLSINSIIGAFRKKEVGNFGMLLGAALFLFRGPKASPGEPRAQPGAPPSEAHRAVPDTGSGTALPAVPGRGARGLPLLFGRGRAR